MLMNPIQQILISLWFIVVSTYQPVSACIPAYNPDITNDSKVGIADYLLIARSFGLDKRDPRYNKIADVNCDQLINQIDLDFVTGTTKDEYQVKPELTGFINQPNTFTLYPQQTKELRIHSHLQSNNSAPFSTHITQTVKPEQGLKIMPLVNKKQMLTETFDKTFKQTITAIKPGKYVLTTTLSILQSNQKFEKRTHISVSKTIPEHISLLKIKLLVEQVADNDKQNPKVYAKLTITGSDESLIEKVMLQTTDQKQHWQLEKKHSGL